MNYSVGVARQFLQSGVIKNNKEIKKNIKQLSNYSFVAIYLRRSILIYMSIYKYRVAIMIRNFIDTGKWKWPKNIHIIGTKIFSRESDIPGRSSRISYDWFDIRTQAMKDISILQEIHGRRGDIYISLRDCVISDEGDTEM